MKWIGIRFREILFFIIAISLSGCSKPIIEEADYPEWWEYVDVSDKTLSSREDVMNFWLEKSEAKDISDTKRVMYIREFFKAAYLAIKDDTLDSDAKVLALGLMPVDAIEVELRRKILKYHIENYWNHEDLDLDCLNCNSANSLAASVVRLAEILAWYDGNMTPAIEIIQKIVREKRYSIDENNLIVLHKTAADIYYKRGMGGKDRDFMRAGLEFINLMPASSHGAEYEKFQLAFHRLRNMCC